MACMIPHLPQDVRWYVAKLKYDLETESYDSFLNDFDISILSHKVDIEQVLQDYHPRTTDIYNIKTTYKPTGLSTIFAYSIPRIGIVDDKQFKNMVIEYIHQTTKVFVKGEWKSTKDSSGVWYYSTTMKRGDVSAERHKQWQDITTEIQAIMMNKFERFIYLEG